MLGIIINPKSGKKAFRAQRIYLWKLLRKRHMPFAYRVTKFAGHATELARELVEKGYDEILILGGDGTLSEAINGIMRANLTAEQRAKIQVGLMPRGTGNDWGRYWNLDKRFKESLRRFFEGEGHPIDIGCVTYWRNGIEHHRYFINSVGFGVDPLCCQKAENLKYYIGSHSINYLFGLIAAIIQQTRQSKAVFLGASPRASVALLQASKAFALLQGRDFITPDDVRQVAPAILHHRLILTAEAEMEGITPLKAVARLIEKVEVPK